MSWGAIKFILAVVGTVIAIEIVIWQFRVCNSACPVGCSRLSLATVSPTTDGSQPLATSDGSTNSSDAYYTDEPVQSVTVTEDAKGGIFSILPRHTLSKKAMGGSVFSIAQPLADVGHGFVYPNFTSTAVASDRVIQIPSDTSRLCVDVGTYIHSPTSLKWWSSDPKVYVIAVEANPFTQMLLWRLSHPSFYRTLGAYWPKIGRSPSPTRPNQTYECNVEETSDCIYKVWSHVIENRNRFLMVPMAAGVQNSISTFQTGTAGRADSGSVLDFRPAYKKKRNIKNVEWVSTAMGTLADVLKHAPARVGAEPLLWDTLKIDAQGFDGVVLLGVGQWLSHFACIVGEFDRKAYSGAPPFNHAHYLVHYHGFAQVNTNIFVNRRYEQQLLSRAVLCSAADVTPPHSKIRKALAKYNSIFGPWDDSKSFFVQKERSAVAENITIEN